MLKWVARAAPRVGVVMRREGVGGWWGAVSKVGTWVPGGGEGG